MNNKAMWIAAIILQCGLLHSATASEFFPFGVEPGAQASKYGGDDQEFGQGFKPPKPHPDFSSYIMQSTTETGICLLRAETEAATAEDVKKKFHEIHTQLEYRYGKAEISETFYLFGVDDDEWVKHLGRGDSHYQVSWKIKKTDENGTDDDEILLLISPSGDFINPYSSKNLQISLQYTFSNYKRCRAVFEQNGDDHLTNKSSNL